MYDQKEYLLAYALVFAFLILGMLIVCIPRPRKKEFLDPETAAKRKRLRLVEKKKSQTSKIADKAKKKKLKAKAKTIKNRKK